MAYDADIVLSPRQALIAAAITGWRGDGPSSWSSPQPKDDILAWARSYRPDAAAVELMDAFHKLTEEGCWTAVRYPIFAAEQYYCHYWSDFIQELPEPVAAYIAADAGTEALTRSWLIAFWDDLFDRFAEMYGGAWIFWGLCAGQGSQGPSDAPWGPCLGPSCGWFQDGHAECNWGIRFRRTPEVAYPDMSILHALHQREWAKTNQDTFCDRVLSELGYPRPSSMKPPPNSGGSTT